MLLLINNLLLFFDFVKSLPSIFLEGGFIVSVGFILSFLFALCILPNILLISKKKRLYDLPDARKCHTEVIPRLGGLVFVPSIFFSLSIALAIRFLIGFSLNTLWSDQAILEFLFLIGGVTALYLVGAKDDLVGVRYRIKFVIQFFAAFLLPLSGLYLNNLYGIFGIYAIPAWIGVPLTAVSIVYITNAVNLIDGIDGLASGGSAIAFLSFGYLFFIREWYLYSMLSMVVFGCLLPFIYYNIFGGPNRRDKIFMGDAGSLTLGYLLAFLSIKYAMYMPEYLPFDVRSLLYPIALLFIPLFDAFRVMVVRGYHRKSLFVADRNHIHHICLKAGFKHLQATVLLLIVDVLLIGLNIFLIGHFNINIVLGVDIACFLILVVCLTKITK